MNVEVRQSDIHGHGVFARACILAGHWQYVYGMLVPVASVYGFEVDGSVWWEPYPPFRYTNHSNEPNCVVYHDEFGDCTVIEALRDIEPGEELTIDYGYDPLTDQPTHED